MVNGIRIPSNGDASIELVELRSLDDYQVAVDGWIEPIDLPDLGVTIYVNEAARRERKPLNSRATLLWWFYQPTWRLRAMLSGDVVVAGILDADFADGEIPREVREQLVDREPYAVQVRPIGGTIWYETRSTYRDYFDALLWGMFLAERWRGTDEVRVVRVPRGID